MPTNAQAKAAYHDSARAYRLRWGTTSSPQVSPTLLVTSLSAALGNDFQPGRLVERHRVEPIGCAGERLPAGCRRWRGSTTSLSAALGNDFQRGAARSCRRPEPIGCAGERLPAGAAGYAGLSTSLSAALGNDFQRPPGEHRSGPEPIGCAGERLPANSAAVVVFVRAYRLRWGTTSRTRTGRAADAPNLWLHWGTTRPHWGTTPSSQASPCTASLERVRQSTRGDRPCVRPLVVPYRKR